MSDTNREMPAVRMTIVGGRPPGCGKELGEIPRGVEVLVKKASVDPWFKELLLRQRAGAAEVIGLALDPAEITLLNFIPAAQLEAVIARTKVEPSKVPAFLGKAAAVMLVALGASTASAQVVAARGARVNPVTTAPSNPDNRPTTQNGAPPQRPDFPINAPGIRPPPNFSPEVSALVGAINRGNDLKKSLDAQKQLLDMGKPGIPKIKLVMSQGWCSAETTQTLQAIIDAINGGAATQPAPAGPDYREVHTLLSQIEFGDDQAIQGATKKLQDMGKAVVPHLKRSLAEDKWKDQTSDQIKVLIATLAKLPDAQPATQPAQTKAVAVEGVPAEVTDLVAALDSRDFRTHRDAQEKLLDMGATVVPHLQKVLREGKPGLIAQARIGQVITALAPKRPDNLNMAPGIRPDIKLPTDLKQPPPRKVPTTGN